MRTSQVYIVNFLLECQSLPPHYSKYELYVTSATSGTTGSSSVAYGNTAVTGPRVLQVLSSLVFGLWACNSCDQYGYVMCTFSGAYGLQSQDQESSSKYYISSGNIYI